MGQRHFHGSRILKKLLAIFLIVISFSSPADAAITVNLLDSGTTAVDGTTASTNSFTATENCLVLANVHHRRASGSGSVVNTTIPTAGGLTWEEVGVNFNGVNRENSILRAMTASPTAAAQTLTHTGETQSEVTWSILEFCGVDTGGTNGSAAIVNHETPTTGTGTSTSLTMDAFSSANNFVFSFNSHGANTATTEGTGFTEAHDLGQAEVGTRIQTQYKQNETAVTSSWTGSVDWMAQGVEIKAADAGARRRNGALVG